MELDDVADAEDDYDEADDDDDDDYAADDADVLVLVWDIDAARFQKVFKDTNGDT